MNPQNSLLRQHILRVWTLHWPLQLATVTVMTTVLMLFNLLAAGVSGAEQLLFHWGQGLEMVVYIKDSASDADVESLKAQLNESGHVENIHFTSKKAATENFLSSLGKDSLSLLSDPKWNSPLPASFEARLRRSIASEDRLEELKSWSASLKEISAVEDVFYGQGWIENFSHFIRQARFVVGGIWVLSLVVGLLIVGNCIRLSFLRRKEEIEVLELVGATPRFVRTPFIAEGIFLGLVSSVLSLGLSYALHSTTLQYLRAQWTFWNQWSALHPLELWMAGLNLLLGIGFGAVGAWLCVRKLNTGWSAAQGMR